MTRPKSFLALFALLFAVASVATAAGAPVAPAVATPQVTQPAVQAEAAVVAPQAQAQGVQSPLLTDAESLLFGAQPSYYCQCRTTSDCPPSCNEICVGAPCGRCAC